MKRIIMLISGCTLSSTILAAVPGASDPTLINIPQLSGGGFYGVTGLYLEPSSNNDDLNYATLNTFESASVTTNNIQSIDPSYEWGIGFNIGYIFANTGNDINLSYIHINTNDSTSINATDPVNQLTTPVDFDDLEILPTQATGNAKYNVNQVDLTVGQYVNVGCRTVLHLITGLRYANLDRTLNSAYAEDPADDSLSLHQKSNFQGIGPLAGVDASYYLGAGFGIVGHFDGALLVGSINNDLTATHIENIGTDTQTTSQGSFVTNYNSRIVPITDSKVGINYTYLFNNANNADLTLEVGYQVSEYFNAFDKLSGEFVLGTFAPGTIQTADVAFQGIYMSLVYHV